MAGRRVFHSLSPPPRDQLNVGVIFFVIAALTNQLAMAALTSTVLTNLAAPDQQQLLSASASKSAFQINGSSNEGISGHEFKVSPVLQQQQDARLNKPVIDDDARLNLNLVTTKLSPESPPSISTTTTSTGGWPSTVTPAVTSSANGTKRVVAVPAVATTTNGIVVDRKTVVEHRNILVDGELNIDTAITPLPLINGPPRQDVVSGRLATTSTSQKNLHRSPNQSSSPHSVAPLNDLQVDERRFLNEIVKNFNKSIVGNAIEFLPAAPGQNSATAVNESYSSPHGQIPKQEHAVVPHEANRNTNTTNSSSTMPGMATVPQLNGHRSHPKSGVGVNAVGPKSGSTKTYEHKSDSAMLNYLFDSFVKHRHSDRRFGPHFVQADGIQLLNASAILGGVGLLSCKISQLQDKTVSWVRRPVDTSEMKLLTVGIHTYSSDARFRVDFQFPDDWRLRIENVTAEDEGTYECMISTHPPQAIQTNFYVSSPEVLIVDEQGVPLYEKFYNLDSLLELKCIVSNIAMTSSVVQWHHDNVSLNYDATRGGISVGTNLTEDAANSTLWVARVKPPDSGNYTCSVGPLFHFTTSVHVLNESLAELHHGLGHRNSPLNGLWLLTMCIVIQLIYLTARGVAVAMAVVVVGPTATLGMSQHMTQDEHIR